MIETTNPDLGEKLSVESTNEMEGMKKRLGALRASSGRVRNVLRRNHLCCHVGAGTVGHFSEETVGAHRFIMQKKLACVSINDLCNTDEVSKHYRPFAKPAIHFSDGPATYEGEKARLIAVLMVLSDGTKAPITEIRRYKKPKSFPRHSDAMKYLGMFTSLKRIIGTHKVCGSRQCEVSIQWVDYSVEG